jgi:hypothetical protein
MKTAVKTTIKGFENLTVKESVKYIYETMQDKNSFILLTSISHNGTETPIGVKKTSVKLFKQL